MGEGGIAPLFLASILRPVGTTGVQTHANETVLYLRSVDQPTELVTPYSDPSWLRTPTFGLRRVIDLFHRPSGVRWYRHWHGVFLEGALRARLHNLGPAVVYAQSPEAAQAALGARHAGQAVVMAAHSGESLAPGWIRSGHLRPGDSADRVIRRQEQSIISQLDGLVYVSDFVRRRMETSYPAATRVPSAVIPGFADIPPPPPNPQDPIRDLITIGWMDDNKNHRFLIDVVARARTSGRDVTLTVVGGGPDHARLLGHARELGVDDLLEFTGRVENAANLIPLHSLYVHAARVESLGIALVEALGHARPILAPAVGGIPEIFTDGIEGLVWKTDDVAGATQLMLTLLGDHERRSLMGFAARETFERRFAKAVVAPRLTTFLLEASARRGRQAG